MLIDISTGTVCLFDGIVIQPSLTEQEYVHSIGHELDESRFKIDIHCYHLPEGEIQGQWLKTFICFKNRLLTEVRLYFCEPEEQARQRMWSDEGVELQIKRFQENLLRQDLGTPNWSIWDNETLMSEWYRKSVADSSMRIDYKFPWGQVVSFFDNKITSCGLEVKYKSADSVTV